ncbi:MAG: ATP synthase F1 subunit delta [Acidimicrobiales bacterium]
MRERLRGYAAAVLGRAREGGYLDRVSDELGLTCAAVFGNDALHGMLTDGSIPVANRRAVMEDLLGRAHPDTVRLVTEAVALERAGELPTTLEWLVDRAGSEVRAGGGRPSVARATEGQTGAPAGPLDPPSGRHATRERLDGFATALFEAMDDRAVVEDLEDELFRFARTVEASDTLRAALTNPDAPARARQAIVADLLRGKARPATVSLLTYAVASARARGLVAMLDWLVERAAAERNLRIADVRTAVDLDDEQRARLTASLTHKTGRQVELRVRVDPDLLGGLVIVVGDTVVDGSVRRRLDQLGAELASGPAPDGNR